MRKLFTTVLLVFLTLAQPATLFAQGGSRAVAPDELTALKGIALSDLRALEVEAAKLDDAISRARAEAEIASAAWSLDETWARRLLSEAYARALPAESETGPASAAAGAPDPTAAEAREVRRRIMQIARRDPALAEELAARAGPKRDAYERSAQYADFAAQAIGAGDNKGAADYILKGINEDPLRAPAPLAILQLAAHDRKAADALILQYLDRLHGLPLSLADQSLFNVGSSLVMLIFSTSDDGGHAIPPPGPEVMKAYVNYVVDMAGTVAQSSPAELPRLRMFLMSAWLPLRQYAPELAARFLELESMTRGQRSEPSLPDKGIEEQYRERYERQVRENLSGDQPNDFLVGEAISRGEFETARKLIGKLKEGQQRDRLTDKVNGREAVACAGKGDADRAESLLEKLRFGAAMSDAYPQVVDHLYAQKLNDRASALVRRALVRLPRSNAEPPEPLLSAPALTVRGGPESDPVVYGLGRLVRSSMKYDKAVAFEALDELVSSLNRSKGGGGRRSLSDPELFRAAAASDGARALQSAEQIKDPLWRVVALAGVYSARIDELDRAPKAPRRAGN